MYISCVADWKDATVVLCLVLVVIGAAAIATAGQSFTIVKGRVLEKGIAVFDDGRQSYPTKTVSVLIENDDRVYNIKRGTVVKYAISDGDSNLVEVGSEVDLLVSSYSDRVRLIGVEGSSPL